ncbi:hypothetical protein [Dasania marina]|uniref:hypothetical protein n=1 Tax=Dasania marina TaxID=471499 RepID=UPI00035C52B6|nr:hypothetical protein [Dasania marina]
MGTESFFAEVKRLAVDIIAVYLTLMKIMIPVTLVVKALTIVGAIEWLALLLSPLMALVGLPDTMGLVWAATMSTNIYAGMIVFYELMGPEPLSVAQVSTLGAMMLLAHSLPVEAAIAKKAGVKLWATLLLRIGGAMLLGVLLNLFYQRSDCCQQAAVLLWQPEVVESSLALWLLEQLKTYLMIFVVIASLMTLLKILRLLGVERLMHWLMSPLLRLLKINNSAADTTIIGVTLGLSFGGALLIREAASGRLSPRDIFLAFGFLALCHSLIEDTLLIMLLGADIAVVLWVRLFFSLLVMAVLARWVYSHEQHSVRHWLMAAK